MKTPVDLFTDKVHLLTHAERHVLAYIEAHLTNAKRMSLTEMAEENNVSTTTVVRMCHHLGLNGFAELKYVLRDHHSSSVRRADNIVDQYKYVLEHALGAIDTKAIEEVTDAMKKSARIVVVAIGLTKPLGEYVSKKLMQMNKTSTYLYELHMIHLLPSWIEEDDLVLCISSSGEVELLIDLIEQLNARRIHSVAITNANSSSLAQLTSQSLNARVPKTSFAGFDITTRSTLTLLLDMIFESYIRKTLKP
jgi:DNA-binding MurR/RpiR family transcriptional regulator